MGLFVCCWLDLGVFLVCFFYSVYVCHVYCNVKYVVVIFQNEYRTLL